MPAGGPAGRSIGRILAARLRLPAGIGIPLDEDGGGGDDVDVEGAAGRPDDRVDDRAPDELGDPAAVGGADHQLGGVLRPGHLHQGRRHLCPHHFDEPAAEVVEQVPVAR